jgi:hypothetical protein
LITQLAEVRDLLVGGHLVVVVTGHGLPRAEAASACRRLSLHLAEHVDLGQWHLSRSASEGLGALAIGGLGPIGVDIECVEAITSATHLELVFDAAELSDLGHDLPALLDAWCEKEAALKAAGSGLAADPRAFHGRTGGDGWHRIEHRGPSPTAVWVYNLRSQLGSGHAGALAILARPDLANQAVRVVTV